MQEQPCTTFPVTQGPCGLYRRKLIYVQRTVPIIVKAERAAQVGEESFKPRSASVRWKAISEEINLRWLKTRQRWYKLDLVRNRYPCRLHRGRADSVQLLSSHPTFVTYVWRSNIVRQIARVNEITVVKDSSKVYNPENFLSTSKIKYEHHLSSAANWGRQDALAEGANVQRTHSQPAPAVNKQSKNLRRSQSIRWAPQPVTVQKKRRICPGILRCRVLRTTDIFGFLRHWLKHLAARRFILKRWPLLNFFAHKIVNLKAPSKSQVWFKSQFCSFLTLAQAQAFHTKQW